MTNRIILAILAGAAAASAASAQKILMTEFGTDSIYRLNLDGSIDNLYTFSDPDNTRLACITRGPDGAFYVANGPTPINDPSQSNIFRLTGLLGGVPNATVFAQSDPLQNPVGLVYDAPTNNFLAANNPVGAMSQQPFAGIVGIDATTGALTEVYQQPADNDPAPAYRRGIRLVGDQTTPGTYLVTSVNGGTYDTGDPGDENHGSTLWRLTVDNTLNGTVDLVADMSTFNTGSPITRMRGLTFGPEGELYVTDAGTDAIYRIDFSGSAVDTITQIFALPAGSGALDIIYQPSSDSLVFSAEDAAELWRVGRDGSGATLLASNFEARGFYLIPAPGAAALLGLAGLAAARRRR
jgi:hypothetical protein